MQVSTAAAPTVPVAAPAIAPGAVLGHATYAMRESDQTGVKFPIRVPITAGRTLLTGVRDIARGAMELIGDHWKDPTNVRATGLVAFVRNGDAWDAVQMLMPVPTSKEPQAIWAPWDVEDFVVEPSAHVDAIWQISAYGFDASSMLPGAQG